MLLFYSYHVCFNNAILDDIFILFQFRKKQKFSSKTKLEFDYWIVVLYTVVGLEASWPLLLHRDQPWTELWRCIEWVLLQGPASYSGKQVAYWPNDLLWCKKHFSLWKHFSLISFPHAGRFEQAFVNSLLSENGANSSMSYWIGLMDMDKKGEYSWLPHNGSSLPLTFTNWNKHQPGSQLLFSFTLFILKNTVIMLSVGSQCESLSTLPSSPFLLQSAPEAVLPCQVDLLLVTGRWKTASPTRPCQCASRTSAVTRMSSCQRTTLMHTPPVLQDGNHTLDCCTVLRLDHEFSFVQLIYQLATDAGHVDFFYYWEQPK